MLNRAFSAGVLRDVRTPGALPQASCERCAFGAKQTQFIKIFIKIFFSPPSRVFSRVARGKGAVARTNSRAQTPDRLSIVFDRARRRYEPAQSRNAQPRAQSDRLHRDNRKPCATARTIPARDD